jgi:hypothetical protein
MPSFAPFSRSRILEGLVLKPLVRQAHVAAIR